MKFTNGKSLIIFALAAAFLNVIFFYGLDAQQIIFSGDQFFRFNGYETFINSFFLRKPNDLSLLNGWQFLAAFWDTLYYQAVYCFGLTPQITEKLLFFLVIYLSLFLSYLGFNKISARLGIVPGTLVIHAVALWYCFNPYTLELWHGGVYNLNSGLTYSLAPLIYYHFSEAIFSATDRVKIFTCALLLAVASFAFWLLASLIFFMVLYVILRIGMQIRLWRMAAKNAFFLGLAYLPLVSFVLFGILHEYFNNMGDNNASFTPTFGHMQGGIWYQLMMLFSWGIYTPWTPGTLYPFGDYFFSKAYIAGLVLLYVTIVVGIIVYAVRPYFDSRTPTGPIKRFLFMCINGVRRIGIFSKMIPNNNTATYELITLVVLFGISVFLAKGAQPPWGSVFVYLYNHVPFFSVFRTPDIRFGFVIVFVLAVLALFVSQCYRKAVFFCGLLGIMFLLAWPFFTGAAVRGENRDDKYYDRIVHIPESYHRIANYINQHISQNTYVLPIPAIEYGHYVIAKGEHLIGQDMLSKLVKTPFVYISASGGMAAKTYGVLKNIVETQQYEKLSDFPIRYVLLRKDLFGIDLPKSEERLARVSDLVYRDSTFSLYEMRNYRSIIDSPNVTFERINPVKYRVSFSHMTEPQELMLLQNFNTHWKVFATANARTAGYEQFVENPLSKTKEYIRNEILLETDDWRYLWGTALAESTHQIKWGYANSWLISPAEIKTNYSDSYYSVNADGSLNFTLTVCYQPQAGYILFAFLSLMAMIIALTVVISRHLVSAQISTRD